MPYKDKTRQRQAQAEWAAKSRREGRAHIQRNKAVIRAAKENKPCVDCGIVYPFYVLQFDHIADNKVAAVSNMWAYSTQAVLAEIAKCELVCANCHAIRTYERMVASRGIAELDQALLS